MDEQGVQMHNYGENRIKLYGLTQENLEFIRGTNLSTAMARWEGKPVNARGRRRLGGARQGTARLQRVSCGKSVLRRGPGRSGSPVVAMYARRRGDGREEEEDQPSPAPLFIEAAW